MATFRSLSILLISGLCLVSIARAAEIASSTPSTTVVKSDFAVDLEEGEQSTLHDMEAQQYQQDQQDNEDVDINEEGEHHDDQADIDEHDLEQSEEDLNQQGEDQQEEVRDSRPHEPRHEEVSGDDREEMQNDILHSFTFPAVPHSSEQRELDQEEHN